MLHSCLHQAIKVKTLTDLNKQILTSQNIPVIVERFINFIFEHGLQTKGKSLLLVAKLGNSMHGTILYALTYVEPVWVGPSVKLYIDLDWLTNTEGVIRSGCQMRIIKLQWAS